MTPMGSIKVTPELRDSVIRSALQRRKPFLRLSASQRRVIVKAYEQRLQRSGQS